MLTPTTDLTPETWSRLNVRLGLFERRSGCHVNDIPRNRSSASCVRPKSAFRVAGSTFKDCPDCPAMVVIPSGSFRMGDLQGDGGDDEKPAHTVTISRPFAVGKYEVTQAEYQAVMGNNPSHIKGQRKPVEQVSWNDAKEFARNLRTRTGKNYRLLSESEWEFVARAGSSTKYPWGNDINSSRANYGRGAAPCRSAPMPPTPLVCTTLSEMCGSGRKTAGTMTTAERRRTAVGGRSVAIAVAGFFAAVPGTADRGSSGRRSASGLSPATGTTTSGSVSPGPFKPYLFSSLLLGDGSGRGVPFLVA